MIVAVTGGTGFIGRHLIARHLARGDEVRFLSRRAQLDGIFPEASFFQGDLTSSAGELRAFVAGVDVLYHCAAELRDEALMQATNVDGTAHLLSAADGRVKRWVQLSSTGVYGNPRHRELDETAEMQPLNAYERSKAAADRLVLEAVEDRRIAECVLLRPSNVYGNDMPNQSLFQLIAMIDKGWFFFIGKESAMANYIHVDNVVEAMVLCATSLLPSNNPTYIVSDHCPLHVWVEIISKALNKPTPRLRVPEAWARGLAYIGLAMPRFPLTSSRIDAMTNATLYQSARIERELGYRSLVSMQAGMTALSHDWQHNHAEGAS